MRVGKEEVAGRTAGGGAYATEERSNNKWLIFSFENYFFEFTDHNIGHVPKFRRLTAAMTFSESLLIMVMGV